MKNKIDKISDILKVMENYVQITLMFKCILYVYRSKIRII